MPHLACDTATFGSSFPTGPATVTLDAAQTVAQLTFSNSSGVTITPGSGGSLTLDNAGFPATVTVTTGSHSINAPILLNSPANITLSPSTSLAIGGAIANGTSANGLTVAGGGTLTLSGSNTYSGGTTLSGGTLQLASNAALGAGPLTVNGNSTLTASGNSTFSGVTNLNSGTLTLGNSTVLSQSTVNVNGGSLDFGAFTAVTLGGLEGQGPWNGLNVPTGSTLTVGANGATTEFDGTFGGGGTLVKTGNGTLILNNRQGYQPYPYLGITGTIALNGGTLQVNADDSNNGFGFGDLGDPGSSVSFTGNATLQFGSDDNWQWANNYYLVGASHTFSIAPGVTATFDTYGSDVHVLAAISGAGGNLTKVGAGTLTLYGANTYSGLTTVSAGTLVLGTAAQSAVFSNGANVEGGNLVFDYVTGSDPISTIVADIKSRLIYNSAATTTYGLGYVNDGAGQVTVMDALYGDANLDGTVNGADLNVVLSNYNQTGMTWSQGDFNYDGAVNGADLNIVLSNYNQTVAATAAVPEPSTLVLLGVAAIGLWAYGRRWRGEAR